MILRTDTKTLVMAALLDGPRLGYALTKALHAAVGDHQRTESVQVYVALRGLEAVSGVLSIVPSLATA